MPWHNMSSSIRSLPATARSHTGSESEDVAKLLLRLTLGALLLHGIGKLSGGIAFVEGALAK
jgi:hypothetical protein